MKYFQINPTSVRQYPKYTLILHLLNDGFIIMWFVWPRLDPVKPDQFLYLLNNLLRSTHREHTSIGTTRIMFYCSDNNNRTFCRPLPTYDLYRDYRTSNQTSTVYDYMKATVEKNCFPIFPFLTLFLGCYCLPLDRCTVYNVIKGLLTGDKSRLSWRCCPKKTAGDSSTTKKLPPPFSLDE